MRIRTVTADGVVDRNATPEELAQRDADKASAATEAVARTADANVSRLALKDGTGAVTRAEMNALKAQVRKLLNL